MVEGNAYVRGQTNRSNVTLNTEFRLITTEIKSWQPF